MTTFTAQSIIDRFSALVQDTSNVRWTQSDVIKMINDGQREAVIVKPEVSVKTASVLLTANTTKQALPADGVMLLDITHNMGADGATDGDAITIVSKLALSQSRPSWYSDAATGKVKNYTFDPRIPKLYHVYPKAPATPWYVEMSYSCLPTDVAYISDGNNTNLIGIGDEYANALLHYVMYAAYLRDSETAGNAPIAAAHYQAFLQSLGAKTQVEMAYNPNASIALPFTNNIPSAASVK